MKILYVAPEFPNLNKNAAQVRSNCLLPLLDKYVDLQILSYPVADVPINGDIVKKVLLTTSRNNKLGLFKSTFSSKPRSFYRYSSSQSCHDMTSLMARFQPDIVHLDSISMLVHIKAAQRTHVVVQPHDSITKVYLSLVKYEHRLLRKLDLYLQYLKFQQIERNIYAKTDLCFVDSETDAEFLRSLNPSNRVEVVPLGFDESSFTPKGTQMALGNNAIVFSGSMKSVPSSHAALELIREIMPRVWQEVPTALLYIVGSNPSKELCQLSDKDYRIKVTGFVDDLGAYLRSAKVYACPLRLGSGMRTRIIEALACGCPVVSTSAGVEGLKTDKVADLPWYIAETPETFASHIVTLLQTPAKCTMLSTHAANYAQNYYSWNSVAKRLVSLYETLIS